MNKPELLAPAGDFERLVMAVEYGADAVYLGSKNFTMRASPSNFTMEELKRAIDYAHEHHVKVHLTCNTLPHNDEIGLLPDFLRSAEQTGVDAMIICDMGILEMAERYAPSVERHISTQAGIVNYLSANAFYKLGAKRVVLARELSLKEIAGIRRNTPEELKIETFIHGAMCVSFSGRCLLSTYLAARDANRGDCAQPCRWSYHLTEETRKGRHLPVFEDDKGTHILNSKDLCMIEHIPEMIGAGIDSFKIEGRAKSAYYVAVVTNAYRMAIDAYYEGRKPDSLLIDEVNKVSNRGYCTGFFFGPIQDGQNYSEESYIRSFDIVAVVEKSENNITHLIEKNPFYPGDKVEMLEPGKLPVAFKIGDLFDLNGEKILKADHPNMKVTIKTPYALKPYTVIRKLSK